MRVLVTGAAGYIGGFLTEHFDARADVTSVVAVDRKPEPWSIRTSAKTHRIVGDLSERTVADAVKAAGKYDVIIHAAFDMKAGYGARGTEVERRNRDMCEHIFQMTFRTQVKTLVYFSSASVYGAYPGNVASHLFRETEPLRENEYPYGKQKADSEAQLRRIYERSTSSTRVAVLRPCSVTGPTRNRAGTKKISLIAFLRDLLPFVPQVTREWARQFVHEEDLTAIVSRIVAAPVTRSLEAYNVAPDDYMLASDIARAFGKRALHIPAVLLSAAMTLAWHATRGRMPTPPGSIRFYKYPINLDGSKLRELGVPVTRSSSQALLATR